jgi:hypothetical protein
LDELAGDGLSEAVEERWLPDFSITPRYLKNKVKEYDQEYHCSFVLDFPKDFLTGHRSQVTGERVTCGIFDISPFPNPYSDQSNSQSW